MSPELEPHYVIAIGEPGPIWHSEPYPNRAAAQAWIDGYMVTQSYKDQHYRVVPVSEFWARHSAASRSRR